MTPRLQKQLDRARRAAGLDRVDVPGNTPSGPDPDGWAPTPIWTIPTDAGPMTRHGHTPEDAAAACVRCGLTVLPGEIVRFT